MLTDRYTTSMSMQVKRGGSILCTLPVREATVTLSADAAIKAALSCVIRPDGGVNLLRDRLCPIQQVNGVDYPMGEYIATTTEPDQWEGWLRVEGYDLCQLLTDTRSTQRYYLPSGRGYLEAIKALLLEAGVARVVADASTAPLPNDMEWEPGSQYLEMVNELLEQAGFGSLWFDQEGVARLHRPATLDARPPVEYLRGDYSILREVAARRTDLFNTPNVFTLVVSSPDGPPMMATAINDSPVSSVSTVNRGRKIYAPIQYLEAVASQEDLQALADQIRLKSMRSTEAATFATAGLPLTWYGNRVQLDGGLYRETGWTATLGHGGGIEHTATREVLL